MRFIMHFKLRLYPEIISNNNQQFEQKSMAPYRGYALVPGYRVVNVLDFGLRGPGFESRWLQNSARDCTALNCTDFYYHC